MAYAQAPGGYGQSQSGFGQQASSYGLPPAGVRQPSGFGQPPAAYGQPSTSYGQFPSIQQLQYSQQPQLGQVPSQLPQQPGQVPSQIMNITTFNPNIASTPISLPGQGPDQSQFPYPDSIMGQPRIGGGGPGYPQVLPTIPGVPGPYPALNAGESTYFQQMGYHLQRPEFPRHYSQYGRDSKKRQKKDSEKTQTSKRNGINICIHDGALKQECPEQTVHHCFCEKPKPKPKPKCKPKKIQQEEPVCTLHDYCVLSRLKEGCKDFETLGQPPKKRKVQYKVIYECDHKKKRPMPKKCKCTQVKKSPSVMTNLKTICFLYKMIKLINEKIDEKKDKKSNKIVEEKKKNVKPPSDKKKDKKELPKEKETKDKVNGKKEPKQKEESKKNESTPIKTSSTPPPPPSDPPKVDLTKDSSVEEEKPEPISEIQKQISEDKPREEDDLEVKSPESDVVSPEEKSEDE